MGHKEKGNHQDKEFLLQVMQSNYGKPQQHPLKYGEQPRNATDIPFSPGWSQMLQKISSTDLCHHSELLCTASQRTCTHDLQNVLLEKISFSWLVFSKHKFNFCGIKLVFSS